MTLEDFTQTDKEVEELVETMDLAEALIKSGIADDKKDEVIQHLYKLARTTTTEYIKLARMYMKLHEVVETLIKDGDSSDDYETRSIN